MSHPSALPATTPSDTERKLGELWECVHMAQELLAHLVFVSGLERGKAPMFLEKAIKNACILTRDEALAYAEEERRGISPSEGSAPDTPTLADHIAREMMWMGHGCETAALYGDDGEMQCQCRVDWKRDPLPALHEHFRAKQLARALAPVPPSAPDTKPDEHKFPLLNGPAKEDAAE